MCERCYRPCIMIHLIFFRSSRRTLAEIAAENPERSKGNVGLAKFYLRRGSHLGKFQPHDAIASIC